MYIERLTNNKCPSRFDSKSIPVFRIHSNAINNSVNSLTRICRPKLTSNKLYPSPVSVINFDKYADVFVNENGDPTEIKDKLNQLIENAREKDQKYEKSIINQNKWIQKMVKDIYSTVDQNDILVELKRKHEDIDGDICTSIIGIKPLINWTEINKSHVEIIKYNLSYEKREHYGLVLKNFSSIFDIDFNDGWFTLTIPIHFKKKETIENFNEAVSMICDTYKKYDIQQIDHINNQINKWCKKNSNHEINYDLHSMYKVLDNKLSYPKISFESIKLLKNIKHVSKKMKNELGLDIQQNCWTMIEFIPKYNDTAGIQTQLDEMHKFLMETAQEIQLFPPEIEKVIDEVYFTNQ